LLAFASGFLAPEFNPQSLVLSPSSSSSSLFSSASHSSASSAKSNASNVGASVSSTEIKFKRSSKRKSKVLQAPVVSSKNTPRKMEQGIFDLPPDFSEEGKLSKLKVDAVEVFILCRFYRSCRTQAKEIEIHKASRGPKRS